jgi:hypothetical protein
MLRCFDAVFDRLAASDFSFVEQEKITGQFSIIIFDSLAIDVRL